MKHTFVICAYKESPYLEECIHSLKRQTVESVVLLATSTPNAYLKKMCEQYDIGYYVRQGTPNIAQDWNYALSVAQTDYVTIAHQDDIYEPDYTKTILETEHTDHVPLIFFTDYSELVNGTKYTDRSNLKIKKILLNPIKKAARQHSRFWKRWILRFGNAVCCPSVTYHKTYIDTLLTRQGRAELFETQFRSNLDWQTWEWLSRQKGSFVYIATPLMAHRIHENSETSAVIQSHLRTEEDYAMFRKFWCGWIAKLLTKAYACSEKSNEI